MSTQVYSGTPDPKPKKIRIVANRLPGEYDPGLDEWVQAPGGLVTALADIADSIHRWVGFTTVSNDEANAALEEVQIGKIMCRQVPAIERLKELHYEGFANNFLWQVFHNSVEKSIAEPIWVKEESEASEVLQTKMAEDLTDDAEPGETIWIHDYQLMRVPELTRKNRPDLNIGYFHHIPFPDGEYLEAYFEKFPPSQHHTFVQNLLIENNRVEDLEVYNACIENLELEPTEAGREIAREIIESIESNYLDQLKDQEQSWLKDRKSSWEMQCRGLLGADHIGFQTPADAQNFLNELYRLGIVEQKYSLDEKRKVTIQFQDRNISVGANPIGINPKRQTQKVKEILAAEDQVEAQLLTIESQLDELRNLEGEAEQDELAENLEKLLEKRNQLISLSPRQIRKHLGNPDKFFSAVERLDLSKGVPERLKLLNEYFSDADQNLVRSFYQVAQKSRDAVKAYRLNNELTQRRASQLSSLESISQIGETKIHYSQQTHTFDQLVALFLATDIMLVTPFKDGMNLVAAEYVHTRNAAIEAGQRPAGVLVLSKYAGIASIVKDFAILVDPNDPADIARGIEEAENMPHLEQKRRMTIMGGRLKKHDSKNYSQTFLADLAEMTQQNFKVSVTSAPGKPTPLASSQRP